MNVLASLPTLIGILLTSAQSLFSVLGASVFLGKPGLNSSIQV